MRNSCYKTDIEQVTIRRKVCPRATWSTINPTWTKVVSKRCASTVIGGW